MAQLPRDWRPIQTKLLRGEFQFVREPTAKAIYLNILTRQFETVIFDCDGTLVDSEPITVRVLVNFLHELGLDMQADEALHLFVGRDMPAIVIEIETRMERALPSSFADEFRERQATALISDLQPINGASKVLESMTRPFCIASNAPQEKIQLNLDVTGLHPFFTPETTFSAYDIEVWKPEPDLFLHAAEKMNSKPEACVVVEDSTAGIDAGLAAGMQVIGFSQSPECKPEANVPFIHSLMDLIEILN